MDKIPKYREDTKGRLSAFKADFRASLAGECGLEHSFYFGTDIEVRESEAYQEYSDYLTDAEMLKVAKGIRP